jgi:hypothetical protein
LPTLDGIFGKLKHTLPATIEENTMPDWLPIVLLPLAYIVIMKWVLPRFGVST